MLIVCASNNARTFQRSQSMAIARALKARLEERFRPVEIVDLRSYRIDMCTMCEQCAETGACAQKDDYNLFAAAWKAHKDVVLVCPHYAGVPSKLMAIAEKLQETAYLKYCQGKETIDPKTVSIIAHGGMTADYDEAYGRVIVEPVSHMMRSMGYAVTNAKIGSPLCIGVKEYGKDKDSGGVCFARAVDAARIDQVTGALADYLNGHSL